MRTQMTLSLVAILAAVCGCNEMTSKEMTASVAATQKAPAFALKDQSVATVSLADYAGKIVVLEWFNPECPFVQRHYMEGTYARLGQKYAGKGVIHLAINSGGNSTPEVNKAFAAAQKVAYPMLDDAKGIVGKAYSAKSTPTLVVIDKNGVIAYRGAIDNDAEGDKSAGEKVNYVEKAVDELLADKAVSVPETKSYGCSVEYATK